MENSTTNCCTLGNHGAKLDAPPFEVFYLKELLAEGIITKELFDMTYNQLMKELNMQKEEM